LLFKRDILYTGNVEYFLLYLCLKQKSIKFKQADDSKIYNNRERLANTISLPVSMEMLVNLAHAQTNFSAALPSNNFKAKLRINIYKFAGFFQFFE
jgi:hypothetical protein